jgi:hypothetical protein
MTTYYKEAFGIVSFETDPQTDINADAKCWHPASDEWVDCPGSTGIGVDVLWSGDYTQILAASVPRCSSVAATFLTCAGAAILKAGRREGRCATNGFGPDPRPTGPRLAGHRWSVSQSSQSTTA